MSRYVPLDHEFDKNKYLELLKLAQGTRQQKDFANDIGMSKTYLNQCMTEKVEKPLTPKTLKKVASASNHKICYSELLDAAGYNPKLYMSYDELRIDEYFLEDRQANEARDWAYERESEKMLNNFKHILGTVTNALAEKGYKWSGTIPKGPGTYFDFLTTLYDFPISEWGFIFVHEKTPFFDLNGPNSVSKRIIDYAEKLLFSIGNPNAKISLVTIKEDIFNSLLEKPIPILALHVSIILLDPSNMIVKKECYIETFFNNHESIPSLI